MTFPARSGALLKTVVCLSVGMLACRFAAADERRIYRCESEGKVTYSDVACSGKTDAVEIERRLNTFDAEPPIESRSKPSAAMTAKSAPRRPSSSIAEEQARHKEKCKALADRAEVLTKQLWSDDSLRSRSKRGEQVKAQQAKLETERRTSRCR